MRMGLLLLFSAVIAYFALQKRSSTPPPPPAAEAPVSAEIIALAGPAQDSAAPAPEAELAVQRPKRIGEIFEF